jgi:hypothetical protein
MKEMDVHHGEGCKIEYIFESDAAVMAPLSAQTQADHPIGYLLLMIGILSGYGLTGDFDADSTCRRHTQLRSVNPLQVRISLQKLTTFSFFVLLLSISLNIINKLKKKERREYLFAKLIEYGLDFFSRSVHWTYHIKKEESLG